jgi:hypothetical protein
MTRLIAILVVASSLAYWFFRRRARTPSEEKSAERAPSSDNTIPDSSGMTTFQTEVAADHAVLGQQDLPRIHDLNGKREASHGSVADLSVAQCTSPEQGNSSQPETDVLVADDYAAEPSGVVEAVDEVLLGELSQSIAIPTKNSAQEDDADKAVLEVRNLKGAGLVEETTADEIRRTAVSGDDPQAESSIPKGADASLGSSEEGRLQERGGSGENKACAPAAEAFEGDTYETRSRYRSPVQRPPRPAPTRRVERQTATAESEIVFDIRVRLTLDRFGFCAITFLPGRTSELDNEIGVKLSTTSLTLMAQEDWYQDLSFPDTSRFLRDGFVLKGVLSDQRRVRWLLRGRDVYVLAAHARASGFVSAPRLVLGRSDIVLCATELVGAVEAKLKDAGCEGYSRLDESLGLPQGWSGFRGVSPTRAIALDVGTSDPFYAIKPAADIEMELEGGVWLRNSVWLAGYPPRIKLFGQTSPEMKVLIDGKEAQLTCEGSLVVDGYDLPGPHSVYCEGLSRSYSIEEPPDSWEAWPAYQFGGAVICGASVQLPPERSGSKAFTVPMSNPLLIGAEPGQIFRCSSRSVAVWRGFVPFDVVWALPAQPLMCNKKIARILQLSDKPLMPSHTGTRPLAWCSAILDASRKGLRIEGGSAESAARWAEYKKTARSIWRSRR